MSRDRGPAQRQRGHDISRARPKIEKKCVARSWPARGPLVAFVELFFLHRSRFLWFLISHGTYVNLSLLYILNRKTPGGSSLFHPGPYAHIGQLPLSGGFIDRLQFLAAPRSPTSSVTDGQTCSWHWGLRGKFPGDPPPNVNRGAFWLRLLLLLIILREGFIEIMFDFELFFRSLC